MMLQILYGDHHSDRHKPGFIDDLKTIFPLEYTKVKGIEKQAFLVHRKLTGQSASDCKIRYVRRARSLKTYGISFFLIKEKLPNKDKIVNRLLGISQESILRFDIVTKELLKAWPLTHVRRWAASSTTFTLDFGGFEEVYLTFLTSEGQAMSKLVAEYIDVILNQRKAEDRRLTVSVPSIDVCFLLVVDSESPLSAHIPRRAAKEHGPTFTPGGSQGIHERSIAASRAQVQPKSACARGGSREARKHHSKRKSGDARHTTDRFSANRL
jgi:hypothetical protein